MLKKNFILFQVSKWTQNSIKFQSESPIGKALKGHEVGILLHLNLKQTKYQRLKSLRLNNGFLQIY